MKKILSLVLAAVFCLSLVACGKKEESKKAEKTEAVTTTEAKKILNPLTGESGFNKSKVGKKPVAVMINNISIAQKIQTGVGDADMVFETLAEGGISRLMAVYADISKVDQIGSVRSARISYAQLASGLDAFYIHCGADNKYCSSSYRKSIGVESLDLGANAGSIGKRIKNGLATEHTLYTFGNSVAKFIKDKNQKIKDSAKDVYKFNDENSPEKFESSAKNIAVKLSGVQTTYLRYNSEDRKYIRGNSTSNLVDYKTGKKEKFKNVLVIFTNVHSLPDGYHMKSDFGNGEGYYFSEGSYKAIKWEKKGETKPLKFFNTDGSDLKLNAGNSYICITDTDNKKDLKIEPFKDATTSAAKAQ